MHMVSAARLTLIVCATLAAAALYLAGDSPGWMLSCLGAGGLALLALDSRAWVKPLPVAFSFIPILGAAGFALWEWQSDGANAHSGAEACVHFILLCQMAAFFSDLRGPQIGMSLAGSVILLLVAVKQSPHSGHLAVLLVMLATATAGLIFRGVLLRQHEFQAMTTRTQRGSAASLVPADSRFSWRTGYTALALTGLATAFGLSAFFFFPRVSFAAPPPNAPHPTNGPMTGPGGNKDSQVIPTGGGAADPGGLSGVTGVAGFEPVVALNHFGAILTSNAQALTLTREKIDPSKPLPGGVLYLRGTTLSTYHNAHWTRGELAIKQPLTQSPDGRWYQLGLEQDKNQVLGAGVLEFLNVALVDWDPQPILFVPGAAERLEKRTLQAPPWRDSDGAILIETLPPEQYRFQCQITPQPLQADDPAPCAHPLRKMTGVNIARNPALLELAGRAVGNARTDQAKVLAITRLLRDSGEYQYTLDIPAMPDGLDIDPIDYFLTTSRRGHCAYFATGFVILARLNRIPCRLATGFAVPVNPDQTVVNVPTNAAHAWAEVYLADRGWFTVDPTPPGANAAALAAHRQNPTAAPADPAPANLPGATDAAATPSPDPILDYSDDQQSALYATLVAGLQWRIGLWGGFSLQLWQLAILLALLGAGLLARRWLQRDEFDETIDGVRVRGAAPRIVFYRRMLAIMKSRGYRRPPAQSASEFLQTLVHRRDPGVRSATVITNVYLLLRFGALNDTDRKAAWKRYRPVVNEHLKELETLLAIETIIAQEDPPPAR